MFKVKKVDGVMVSIKYFVCFNHSYHLFGVYKIENRD